MKIVYHSDADGYCAGAIAYRYFKKYSPLTKIDLIEMDYGYIFPLNSIEPEEQVVIVDFSLEQSDWEALINLVGIQNITWIDHHKSAIEKYQVAKTLPGIRDISHAACKLTWQYYHKCEALVAVELIGDYDTWTFAYPDSKDFHAGLKLANLSPDSKSWNWILSKDNSAIINEIIKTGKTINFYDKKRFKKMLNDRAYVALFNDMECLCCNSNTGSLTFNGKDKDFKICSTHQWDGKNWKVSIYSSDPSIDCANIALTYGGGGHKGAAGFHCKELPFTFIRYFNKNLKD